MQKYIVGRAGFEYNDEYYHQGDSDGIETAEQIVDTKAEADKLVAELSVKDVRSGKDMYRIGSESWDWDKDGDPESFDWGALTDDGILAKLKKVYVELYRYIPLVGRG